MELKHRTVYQQLSALPAMQRLSPRSEPVFPTQFMIFSGDGERKSRIAPVSAILISSRDDRYAQSPALLGMYVFLLTLLLLIAATIHIFAGVSVGIARLAAGGGFFANGLFILVSERRQARKKTRPGA
jgi:hypothetical protein